MIRTSSFLVFAALCLGVAHAGAQVGETPLHKQLSRIDFGISADGVFTKQVTGPVLPSAVAGGSVSDSGSNTVGALVNLRYIAKPYFGLEFNFGYARYTQDFSRSPFGVQNNADEYTFGYIVTPPRTVFGLQTFASAGLGTTKFQPTRGGGQGLNAQARATYYYSLGLQKDLFPHLGARVGFRQTFYLAPDFGQNYLTIKQHTFTSEPTIGFYTRF